MIPSLYSIKFTVGNRCNLSCGFCLQQNESTEPTLDFGMVVKLLSQPFVHDSVKLITLTGGEPTFLPYNVLSLKIIKAASALGMESCIFTNGCFLNDQVLQDYKNVGLSRFRVSMYDPVEKTYWIQMCQRLKKYGFPLMMKYTVTRENFKQLDHVLNVVEEVGIELFQIKPFNRIEDEKVDLKYELLPEQVLAMAQKVLDFKKKAHHVKVDMLPLCYEFLVDDSLSSDQLSPCNCGKGPRGYFTVTPTGEIKICGAYPKPIGSITDDIEELWTNHPLLAKVRNLGNRPKPKECEDCPHWEKCSVTDCHSATYAQFGSLDHANPQCPRVQLKRMK